MSAYEFGKFVGVLAVLAGLLALALWLYRRKTVIARVGAAVLALLALGPAVATLFVFGLLGSKVVSTDPRDERARAFYQAFEGGCRKACAHDGLAAATCTTFCDCYKRELYGQRSPAASQAWIASHINAAGLDDEYQRASQRARRDCLTLIESKAAPQSVDAPVPNAPREQD